MRNRIRARGAARLAVKALVLSVPVVFAVAPSFARGPLDLLTYTIHTTYASPSGDIEVFQPAVLLAPTPVDADRNLDTGTAGQELLVQLQIDAGRATLRVSTLPGAPSPFPVAVEAILADPRGGSPLRVAFGYDARADTAPAAYDATIALFGASRVTSFSLDLHTVAAGSTLGVTAEVFDEGPSGERLNPIRGRIDYTPVPTAAHFGVLQGSDFGLQQSSLDLVTDTRSRADVVIEDLQGNRTTRVDATLDALPNTLSLVLTETQTQTTFNYQASARVDLITLNVTDLVDGSRVTNEFHLRLEDMSLSATLIQDSPTHATFASESPIGAVQAGVSSGGEILWRAEPAYIYVSQQGTHESLAFRLLGLSAAELDTGDPVIVDVTLRPGPFHVLVEDGSLTIDAWIRDLPSHVRVAFSTTQGTVDWSGSAPIGEITIDATDPAGISGRATALALRLVDLPNDLGISWNEAQQRITFDAKGGRVGLVTLDLTSGPILSLDPGFDGIVFEDLPSHYALAVKLTGLELISVTTGEPPYSLDLRKTAGPFMIRLLQGAASTRINVLDLPSSLQASFDPAGTLAYTASAGIGEINAEIENPAGVSGRATRATALLRSIPNALDVGWNAAGGTVTADAKGKTVGLLEVLLTSGPSQTLPADRDGIVFQDLADRYVAFGRLTNLKKLTVAQGPPPSLTLDTAGGRLFVLDIRQAKTGGVATTSATLNSLPASVSFQFTSATTFAYTASSSMSSLTIDAFDPAGISGRANTMHVLMQSLPVALDVSWESSGRITLDAKGGTVGLIEVQLTSGPDDRIAASFDGLLLNDLADRYVVFARITGMRKVVATQTPAPDITLETTGGRILKVEINQLKGAKVEYTRATLDRLVSSVTIRFAENTHGQELFYTASAPTNSVVIDTNSGDRWNLNASIASPLPASVYFCSSGNGYCTGFARSSGAGAFKFSASEHTTLNVFDCVRPLTSACTRTGSPTEFTRVDNWRIRYLEQDADADGAGFSGYMYMNTTSGGVRHSLSGYLLNRNTSGGGFEASFPTGFWADHRRGSWDAWGLFKSKSGSINCPGGTSLSVRVLGIWIGVTSYLC